MMFSKAHWRINKEEKVVYLTFDDGPIPEVTPWVLDTLDKYSIKATFFCVGDNIRKYTDIFEEVVRRGHRVGNHTFNHLQGWRTLTRNYIANVTKADKLIKSNLFRPPHGHVRLPQLWFLNKHYKVIMWDVVTRDYNPDLTGDDIINIVKKRTRNGSIIVFHDSVKSIQRLQESLEASIQWLLENGYRIEPIP
ncbi:MAG: polysaccharide deacetylase family protein [Bacteroidales bacterium]